jgi:ketosteroid isomerase-like protein
MQKDHQIGYVPTDAGRTAQEHRRPAPSASRGPGGNHFWAEVIQAVLSLSATPNPRGSEFLAEAPGAYFRSIDAKDLEATMEHYADDAVEIIMPDDLRFEGREAIREMYVNFFDDFKTTSHDIRNLVVDPAAGKVATEQSFRGQPSTGESQAEMYNCNFFEFNNEGKLSRVIIWMSGMNPLR